MIDHGPLNDKPGAPFCLLMSHGILRVRFQETRTSEEPLNTKHLHHHRNCFRRHQHWVNVQFHLCKIDELRLGKTALQGIPYVSTFLEYMPHYLVAH